MFDQADVQQLVDAFLTLEDADDVRAFLTDLCTPREISTITGASEVAVNARLSRGRKTLREMLKGDAR